MLTWAFALLVTFYLLTTAVGGVIGGAFSAVSGALSAAGQTVKDAAPQAAQAAGVTPDMIQRCKASSLGTPRASPAYRRDGSGPSALN